MNKSNAGTSLAPRRVRLYTICAYTTRVVQNHFDYIRALDTYSYARIRILYIHLQLYNGWLIFHREKNLEKVIFNSQ